MNEMNEEVRPDGTVKTWGIDMAHSLRARTAVFLFRAGVDTRKVQERLGYRHLPTPRVDEQQRFQVEESVA